MSPTWRRRRAIAFHRPATEVTLDYHFPRAVAGEEYDRYARAVWPQGQRWIHEHWARVITAHGTMDDARETLRTLASSDLARDLNPQEEKLLGELLQVGWRDWARPEGDVVPETAAVLTA